MHWLLLPLGSFAAMFAQDVLGVIMVRAEATGRANRAALCDMAQDVCAMAQLAAFGDAVLIAHDLPLTAAVIGARLSADYFGTRAGVQLGQRLDLHEHHTGRAHQLAPPANTEGEAL